MKKIIEYVLKTLKWLVIGVAGLLVLVFALIYLPPVQDLIVSQALKSVNKGGDMHIAVQRARLTFPLKLQVDSLAMQSAGMEIGVGKIRADVAVMPLLGLNVDLSTLDVNSAVVNIGTPDSALYMRADVASTAISDASVGLLSNRINVGSFLASGGNINLTITPDTVPSPKSESAPAEWNITLSKVQLEKIDYTMQMLPTIDSLHCNVPVAKLIGAEINLKNSTVNLKELLIDKVDARYIVPTAEYVASHPAPVAPSDTTAASAPWQINARKLRLTDSHAIYATRGATPTANFDPLYIEASQINLAVDSFLSHGTTLCVPLTNLSARERCGISLAANGVFAMDSTALYAQNFHLNTPASKITFDATMGLDTVNPPLNAVLSASISPDDLKRLMPAAAAPIAASLPPYTPLEVEVDVTGRMNNLLIRRASASIPRHITVELSGNIADYSDLNRANGTLRISGSMPDGNFIKPALLDAKTGRQVNLPPLRLTGLANVKNGIIDGNLSAVTGDGDIALDAWWNNRSEAYDVALNLHTFPIQSILPLSGARDIDGSITASGQGIDFFSPATHANAKVDLHHVDYNGRSYNNVTLDAALSNGHADVTAESRNKNANFTLTAAGNLTGKVLDWTFNGDIRHIDLQALALSDSIAEGSVKLSGNASFSPAVAATRRTPGRPMTLRADVNVADLYWHMPGEAVNASGIDLQFNADTASTDATLTNRDLAMEFKSPVPLDTLTKRFNWASLALDRDMRRRRLAIDTLQRALPPFALTLQAGTDNLLANYLMGSDITFKSLNLNATNDSLLNIHAYADGIKSGETAIDTITADFRQRADYLLYKIAMHNRPGTLDQFADVSVRGYINADRLALLFKQENLQGETGYSFGAMAKINDQNDVQLRFVPFHPIIGYKEWEVNKDNVITYNLSTYHLDANLDLHNDVSSLKLYTEHHPGDSVQEDVILKVKDIKLSDWIALNPFAPPITGDVSADMRVSWHKPDLNGTGTVSLNNFIYGKKRVGDFELAVDLTTNTAGTIRANTSLMVNGVKTITAVGNLNDSTAEHPFLLDFRMIHFPLAVANPFLPPGTATLSGVLNGEMDITGEMAEPQFNGYLDFDTTTINVDMLGTPFKVSDVKIPVENNIVNFNNFAITGVNDKPLTINGNVDLTSLSEPRIDLTLKARDMQIVGSEKSRRSTVYGKAFINLDASVKGSMQFLDVNADLNLLPGTNVTYVMADAATAMASRSNQDMVKFVNFNDTTTVANADTIAPSSMLMNLDAKLTISNGTTVTVDLDATGKNKVQLQSSGTVNYTMDYMNDERFTGRINLNGGFARYSIPVMGEKMFNFMEGSYVEFNGSMLNPILNVHAYDEVRANVAQDGTNSRVVNFNVLLNVTGTLEQMNVVFDLECPDDITIANELKSMTAEQRANQAMNLLITGMYRSGGTQTISSGNAGTNALFSFLESQLNSWASGIKGVDISFGIDQYDKTVDGANTTAMSYSYKVSKSLFDDRFKIVVGGNYSTDAEADENFAQNLIADISFEYMLNKAGTMYVKLFRHSGYESILEGEITQTGVGFVYKKKISRIADIFNFLPHRHRDDAAQSPQLSEGNQPVPGSKPAPKPEAANASHKATLKTTDDDETSK